MCFEELRRDILSFSNGDERDHGKMGLYVDVVMTYGIRGENYTELQHRDQCGAAFERELVGIAWCA